MGAPAGSWTSGLTSPDGPDSYQWNYTTHKTHTSSVREGDAVHSIASFIGTCTRASGDGEQSSPPLTYLTRCSMNLTEQFLFLKTPYQRPQQTLPIPADIENKRTPGSGDTKRFQILAVVHWGLHTGSCFVWPPRINTTQQRKGGRHLSNTHAGVMCLY